MRRRRVRPDRWTRSLSTPLDRSHSARDISLVATVMGRVARVLTGCALLAAMGAGGGAAEVAAGPVTPTGATPFDVDGDGIANLVIGVPGEDFGGLRDVGVAHVLGSARTG